MRVLVISPVHPCPPDRGSKIRVFHNVQALLREHRVRGLAFGDSASIGPREGETDSNVCEAFQEAGAPRGKISAAMRSLAFRRPYRSAKFESRHYRERLRRLFGSQDFDLIWVHFAEMLRFLRDPALPERIRQTPVVLDQHNDMEQYWSSFGARGNLLESAWARWNIQRVRIYRKEMLQHCDLILSVSRDDARTTRKVASADTPVVVAPNGVDTEYFAYVEPSVGVSARRILFVGSMDVTMNVDAVTWFTEEIFPNLRKRIVDASFLIVGRDPTAQVKSLAETEGVRVTGRVDDIREYYEQAAVAVVPTRQGGGTKLKVLEAMATGTPVVSTTHGARGHEVEDGIHLKIADEAVSFAEAVATLLTDVSEARRLARAARDRVCERYTWPAIYGSALEQIDHHLSRA